MDHIQTLFSTHNPVKAGLDFQTSRTLNKGHGWNDERTLISSGLLTGYTDWPYVAQVFQLIRKFTFVRKGQAMRVEQAAHSGLTSLSCQKDSATDLLALKRAYWQIETGPHYRCDVTFHEDATCISQSKAALNLTIVHNTILSLFARLGCRNASLTSVRLDGSLDFAFTLLTSAHLRI